MFGPKLYLYTHQMDEKYIFKYGLHAYVTHITKIKLAQRL